IHPTNHYCFLGLIVDQKLTWKKHIAHTIAKGTEYILQLHCLSRTANRISTKLMCQLYITIAIPKFIYGTNIWFCHIYKEG
ncbi:hypothetical protein CY34DRAFT_88109, partial [Suillus luteus UH-Slu-Lm8-n1]